MKISLALSLALMWAPPLQAGEAEDHFEVARELNIQQRYDEAAARLRKAIALKPKWPVARKLLGIILRNAADVGGDDYQAKKYRWLEAEKELRQAIRLGGNDPEISAHLADILERKGNYDEAIREARKALASDPGDMLAVLAEMKAQLKKGRLQEVDLSGHRALEALTGKRDIRDVHFLMGQARAWKKDLDGALEQWQKAHDADPVNVAVYHARIEALGRLGRVNDAVAAARELVKLYPDDYRSHLAAAGALREAGKKEAAWDELELSIKLDPGVLSAGRLFERGLQLQEKGRGEEARAEFAAYLELIGKIYPAHKDPWTLEEIATARKALGRTTQAKP